VQIASDSGRRFRAEPVVRPQLTVQAVQQAIALSWQLPWTEGLRRLILLRGSGDNPLAERIRWTEQQAASLTSWTDSTATAGVSYQNQIEMQGNDQILQSETVTARWGAPPTPLPARLAIVSIAPNPFNPSTKIVCTLPAAGGVNVRIYDARGRLVTTLLDGPALAGTLVVTWDGRDVDGPRVASGVYEARLTTLDAEVSRSMAIVR
jgi:hypothetical protein